MLLSLELADGLFYRASSQKIWLTACSDANALFCNTSFKIMKNEIRDEEMIDDYWLHIHSRLANLRSTSTWITQLIMEQIEMTIVSLTSTFLTSLQHIPVNLLSNNCQSYVLFKEIHCSCQQKLFLQGWDTVKLHDWIGTPHIARYIANPGPTWVRGLI